MKLEIHHIIYHIIFMFTYGMFLENSGVDNSGWLIHHNRVSSVSPLSLKRNWKYLVQLYISIRWCIMNQVKGQNLYCIISILGDICWCLSLKIVNVYLPVTGVYPNLLNSRSIFKNILIGKYFWSKEITVTVDFFMVYTYFRLFCGRRISSKNLYHSNNYTLKYIVNIDIVPINIDHVH